MLCFSFQGCFLIRFESFPFSLLTHGASWPFIHTKPLSMNYHHRFDYRTGVISLIGLLCQTNSSNRISQLPEEGRRFEGLTLTTGILGQKFLKYSRCKCYLECFTSHHHLPPLCSEELPLTGTKSIIDEAITPLTDRCWNFEILCPKELSLNQQRFNWNLTKGKCSIPT